MFCWLLPLSAVGLLFENKFLSSVAETETRFHTSNGDPRGDPTKNEVTGPCSKCNIETLCPDVPEDPETGLVWGQAECLPVVCMAICSCREGLPEPPSHPPDLAILPPPLPDWNKEETTLFCSCAATREVNCATDLCREKINQVRDLVHCDHLYDESLGDTWPPPPGYQSPPPIAGAADAAAPPPPALLVKQAAANATVQSSVSATGTVTQLEDIILKNATLTKEAAKKRA